VSVLLVAQRPAQGDEDGAGVPDGGDRIDPFALGHPADELVDVEAFGVPDIGEEPASELRR
jgi:hypothetical protein